MKGERWLLAGIAGLAILYLIQLASPLRIDNDAVAYLIVAMDLADGLPATGALPVGYPWIIALLERAGIASAPTIVLLNFVFVAAGLAAVWYIGRDRSLSIRGWTTGLTLLSYPMIRETMMPHPEAVYFGLSLVAIAVMTSVSDARTRRNLYLIGIATGLIVIAVTFRIAAITLVLPLLWILYRIARPKAVTRFQHIALVAGLFMSIAVALGAALMLSEGGTLTRYVADAAKPLAYPPLSLALRRLDATLRALGELSLNLPASRVDPVKALVPLFGIPVAWLFIRRAKVMNWRAPVLIYVATYVVVLIAWPFFATRLWIPIIPLLLLHMLTALSAIFSKPGGSVAARAVVRAWTVWFVTIGVLGLVYTVRISLSGENFRYRYGVNGGMASPGHETSAHNRDARRVVARYDSGNRAWRWMKLSADPRP